MWVILSDNQELFLVLCSKVNLNSVQGIIFIANIKLDLATRKASTLLPILQPPLLYMFIGSVIYFFLICSLFLLKSFTLMFSFQWASLRLSLWSFLCLIREFPKVWCALGFFKPFVFICQYWWIPLLLNYAYWLVKGRRGVGCIRASWTSIKIHITSSK